MEERYGRLPVDLSPVDRLEAQLGRRRQRVAHLENQIAGLQAEIDRIEQETAGYLAGVEALLDDALDRVQRLVQEAWSPAPVLGYRMWNVTDGALTGAVQPWRALTKGTVCLNGLPGEDLPHSHGRCGPPPCGVYTTKQPETIFAQMPRKSDWAIGVVAMTGKVVEHTKGYRAERATMVGLWLVVGDRSAPVEGASALEDALADPARAVLRGARRRPDDAEEFEDACRYLAGLIERRARWTSENKNA